MPEYNDAHLLDFDRVGKITASLVGAIMGLDPNISRQEAWRRILGRAKERPTNPDQQRGIDNEANALAELEVNAGIFLLPGKFIPHPQIPWLGASPDGLTTHHEPAEVKCPRTLHAAVPAHYEVQVLTQIECCGADRGWFASWVDNGDGTIGFYWTEVPAQKQYWWDTVYKELYYFYHEYVKTEIEPPRRKKA